MNLQGKSAVVTGGASGIGRATLAKLAAAGARVFIADIDKAKGEATAAEEGKAGHKVSFVQTDLLSDPSVAAFAKQVLAEVGRLDILVNAAGWDQHARFLDTKPEFWQRVIGLNLLGPIRMTHAFLPGMVEAQRGKIVNVSSDAGRVGSSGETPYAAAKGGVIAFTKSVAREMARFQINVNCVCPGPTDTPLFASTPQNLREALAKAIPFRRVAKPEEVADAIVYFCGPGCDYVTGQVLSVSGGLTMNG
ncbi:MAG: SDR family oxidoreductase [Alphaproteobacteria bacterium]|nr:SDR family oxidoreductase [Alphaproteobacteria bacterium]